MAKRVVGLLMRLRTPVHVAGSLWLAAFSAYVAFLALPLEDLPRVPFGLSKAVAGLIGALVFALLAWRLLRPLGGGRAPSARRWWAVMTLAAATVALDAGQTHWVVPRPALGQDACRFGAITPEDYLALASEVRSTTDIPWGTIIPTR
jgi:hypothetical protein